MYVVPLRGCASVLPVLAILALPASVQGDHQHDVNLDGSVDVADVLYLVGDRKDTSGVVNYLLTFEEFAYSVPEMLPVPAGTFTMGRRDDGDDALADRDDELPRHEVALSAYQVGKFEVTNAQFCDVMNWSLAQGYLRGSSGEAWSTGSVYFNSQRLFYYPTDFSQNIDWNGNAFAPKTLAGEGGTSFSMANHPIVNVSWYGALAYCNWLSQLENLAPAYDFSSWTLIDGEPGSPGFQFAEGFRLPTEAEWERAAAWDGSKHWIYGFSRHTLPGTFRCNYDYANPLGLPHRSSRTSPVGWFDGTNISPNGAVQTLDSVSPVGAYDMSGNGLEWCYDWKGNYNSSPQTNPTGPISGTRRIVRGGALHHSALNCRSAIRGSQEPRFCFYSFRVARTLAAP